MERLRYLVEVDRRGSIGAAASALYITPSAVSQQIKALSKSVGVDVIDSLPSGSRCTPAGRILVDHALRAMAELALAEDSLRALAAHGPQQISMACFPSAVGSLLPRILRQMTHEYPELRLKFNIMGSSRGLQATISGIVDVALIARYPQDNPLPRALHQHKLGHDTLQIIVPRVHRLADAPVVSLHDLQRDPLLMEGELSPSCLAFIEASERARFSPNIKAYSPDSGVSITMAEDGLGIAVVPKLALNDLPGDLVCRTLEPPLARTAVIVCRRTVASSAVVQTLFTSASKAWQLATA